MIDTAEFRRVVGHFATGVTVVTTRRGDGFSGLTASAFCSVSLEPTLVLVCVDRKADSHDCIAECGVFAVNVLSEDHGGETLARHFADTELADKFLGVAFRAERTGCPVLDEALAWMDCRLAQRFDGGDHTVYLGEVLAADAVEGTPLLYYRGGYGRFAP
jgi:4-nitrophenol 2-monooxygenase / 4-nitrocatechol 4-monooxygenase, reductase component